MHKLDISQPWNETLHEKFTRKISYTRSYDLLVIGSHTAGQTSRDFQYLPDLRISSNRD
jgi:hypothetical protein